MHELFKNSIVVDSKVSVIGMLLMHFLCLQGGGLLKDNTLKLVVQTV